MKKCRVNLEAVCLLAMSSIAVNAQTTIFSDDFDTKTATGAFTDDSKLITGTYIGDPWTVTFISGAWDSLAQLKSGIYLEMYRDKTAGNCVNANMESDIDNSLAEGVTVTFDFAAGYNQNEWQLSSPEVPFAIGFDGSGNELFQLRTGKGTGSNKGYIHTSASATETIDEFSMNTWCGFELDLHASTYDLKVDRNADGDFEDTGEVVTGISYTSGSNDGTFGRLSFYSESWTQARIDNIVVTAEPIPEKGSVFRFR